MTETKWLTIAEASLLCSEMGLARTNKTIRSWCRKGDVLAEKQTTQNGDMWVLDKDSLTTKIKFELEVRDQKEQARTLSEPVQTGSNPFEPVRTRADRSSLGETQKSSFGGYHQGEQGGANQPEPYHEPRREPKPDPSAQAQIRELENKVMALSVDVGWRDKMLDKLQRENEKGQDTLHGQARYIGHLESDLMRLGGKPDQTFLAAPKPKNSMAENAVATEPHAEVISTPRPNPNQSSFYQGHTG